MFCFCCLDTRRLPASSLCCMKKDHYQSKYTLHTASVKKKQRGAKRYLWRSVPCTKLGPDTSFHDSFHRPWPIVSITSKNFLLSNTHTHCGRRTSKRRVRENDLESLKEVAGPPRPFPTRHAFRAIGDHSQPPHLIFYDQRVLSITELRACAWITPVLYV